MAIPGLGAAATSDKGKKFLSGFANFMTGGGLAGMAGRKVGEVLDPTGEGAGKRLKEIGKMGVLGGLGSFAANAMDLNKVNGTKRGDTGEMSQGAQELAQKVQQNEMSGLQQRTANFLQNVNPYNSLYPGSPENPMDPMGVPLVPGPDGQLINENLFKQTGGDPAEIQRRKEILQQNPAGNPYSSLM